MTVQELKPCPFCGGEAELFRVGTIRVSCIVKCTKCGCELESNEIGYGEFWNQRAKIIEEKFTSGDNVMQKCAECGKLLGIHVNGKPYHYGCADKFGSLTS